MYWALLATTLALPELLCSLFVASEPVGSGVLTLHFELRSSQHFAQRKTSASDDSAASSSWLC